MTGELTIERLRYLVTGRLRQLEESERFDAARLAEMQRLFLGALVHHCLEFSPGLQRRAAAAGLDKAALSDPQRFGGLAPLTRRELQAGGDLFCGSVPEPHLPISSLTTSGSTGEPVEVRHTLVNQIDWLALTLREHRWHNSDYSRPLAVVRGHFDAVQQLPDWGSPVKLVAPSGPAVAIPNNIPMEQIFALLEQTRPGQLLIYPGSLAHMCDYMAESGKQLVGLQRIRSIGEMLRPELRERVQELFGLPIADVYSSRENGTIAIQCPVSGLYHVAETVILEVLDGAGEPCAEGEEGEVLITDLRNYATPLIRYRIGDRAVVGGPCACGRNLPTLERIMGRERNLIRMPDGSRGWPQLAHHEFWKHGPVTQFQFIQHGADEIEARLAVSRPVTPAEEQALTASIQHTLRHPFALRFSYFEGVLPLPPSGKREDFVCLI